MLTFIGYLCYGNQSVQLQKEVETLQIQIERNSELHQIELKERDMQLDQLRRQLKYAVAEEEETRSELKAVTNEYSSEKLKLQKKIVELDSKLQFVESSLNEWKEKALESASQLRTVTRQSKLKVCLRMQLAVLSKYRLYRVCMRLFASDPTAGGSARGRGDGCQRDQVKGTLI